MWRGFKTFMGSVGYAQAETFVMFLRLLHPGHQYRVRRDRDWHGRSLWVVERWGAGGDIFPPLPGEH